MVEKKELSEKHRLIQVSVPPDVAVWWDSIESGEKSWQVVRLIRAEMERGTRPKRKA